MAVYADTIMDIATGSEVRVEVRRPYACPWDTKEEASEQLVGFLDERIRDYENERLLGVILERAGAVARSYDQPDLHWHEIERLTSLPSRTV